MVFYTAEKAEKVPGKSNTEHGVVLRRRRNWPRRVDKEGGVAENKRQKPMGNSVFSQRWHKWQNSNNGVLLLPMRNRKYVNCNNSLALERMKASKFEAVPKPTKG